MKKIFVLMVATLMVYDGKGTEDAGGDDHTSGAKCGGANEGEGPVALDARCEEGGGRFCGKAGDGDLRC